MCIHFARAMVLGSAPFEEHLEENRTQTSVAVGHRTPALRRNSLWKWYVN